MSDSKTPRGYCAEAAGHPFHGPYHDKGYGFPLTNDGELFEHLILEINQADLSWPVVLKKQDHLRPAPAGFSKKAVARSEVGWVSLSKRAFRFTAGEIIGTFLLSTGYLPGAHVPACPDYERIAAAGPPWLRTHHEGAH